MKQFLRNRKNRKKRIYHASPEVFIERVRENHQSLGNIRKHAFFRKKLSVLRKLWKYAILFVFIVLLSGGLFLVFNNIININGSFISPLPAASQPESNLIDNKIKSELNKQQIGYKKIDTTQELYYTVILTNEKVVLLSANKDIGSQIASLQFILNRLTMEGREFKVLDLRFDKPVISF